MDWPILILLGALIPVSIGLLMGPGGCRFGDYWRLGLPLSLLILLLGTPLVASVWGS